MHTLGVHFKQGATCLKLTVGKSLLEIPAGISLGNIKRTVKISFLKQYSP
jgi:hypothetical protein